MQVDKKYIETELEKVRNEINRAAAELQALEKRRQDLMNFIIEKNGSLKTLNELLKLFNGHEQKENEKSKQEKKKEKVSKN